MGYEDDSLSSEEISEFVAVRSHLLGMDTNLSIPFPKADEVSLRPRHAAARFTKRDLHNGSLRSSLSQIQSPRRRRARALRKEFHNPPDVIADPRTEQDIVRSFRLVWPLLIMALHDPIRTPRGNLI
jgi:alkyldihydroxyacetonephosphate synthase